MSLQNRTRLGSALLATSLLLASCTGADTDQAVDSESSAASQPATDNDANPTDAATETNTGDGGSESTGTTTSSGPLQVTVEPTTAKPKSDSDSSSGSDSDSKSKSSSDGSTNDTKRSSAADGKAKNNSRSGTGAGATVSGNMTTKNSQPGAGTGSASPSRQPTYSVPTAPSKTDAKTKPKTASPTTKPESANSTGATTSDSTDGTAKPAEKAKPAETAKPATTSKPATTAKPAAPSDPGTRPSGQMVWGYDASAPSGAWKRPSIGSVYTDPAYNTSIRRVTSADGTRFNRNTYSRRQAENANGSMFMTYHGDAAYHIYTVANGSQVAKLTIGPDSEPQWHPTRSNIIRHMAGANSYTGELKLYETDVNTNRTTPVADLTQRLQSAIPGAAYMIDRAEGSPSMDGDRYAWIVYNSSERPIGLVSYDLGSDTVLGTAPLRTSGLDWVGMSPKGNYVVAGYLDGTTVYNADLTNMRELTQATEHSDIALDKSGRETYVYIDFESSSPTNGWLTAVDMATLKRTKIFDIYNNANSSVHVSGKGFNKPGWVVVSTYSCKVPGAWTCNKVMAVEIADQGRILNLAHTYNCGDNYWTETHAVVNRSFTRVYYNSDAGSCGIDAEVYRLDVPRFD